MREAVTRVARSLDRRNADFVVDFGRDRLWGRPLPPIEPYREQISHPRSAKNKDSSNPGGFLKTRSNSSPITLCGCSEQGEPPRQRTPKF